MARRLRKLTQKGTVRTVSFGDDNNTLRIRNHADGIVAVTVQAGADPDTDFSDSDDPDTRILPKNGDYLDFTVAVPATVPWDVRIVLLDGVTGAVEMLEY